MRGYGYGQLESVFVGAALVATSVGITARVLDTKGLMQHEASRTILAAAVIDDVLGLLVLAVVSGMAKGNVDVMQIGATALVSVGFTLLIVFWGAKAMNQIVPRINQRLRGSEAQFSMAMVLLFILSVLALYAGVAAIIGAFLAGVALSESVTHRVHDLAQGVTELLVPFFLAGIGLHFDLTAVSERSTMILAVVILIAAVVTKLIGCGLGSLSMGKANAIRIGVGMAPRGEVGMVVAQLGLAVGVISGATYSVIVFMAVMTTVVAPPMLTWAFRGVAGVPKERFTLE
jgi:Kef-type K+ transport system membrane component KefB